jgi:xanthine dehydrogenase accessory factor
MMLAGREGRLWGTIGGALSEYLALEKAKALIDRAGGPPWSSEKYILHPNEAADIGARCGGEISVFFRLLKAEEPGLLGFAEKGIACCEAAFPSWFLMEIAGKQALSLGLAWEGNCTGGLVLGSAPGNIARLTRSRPAVIEEEGRRWFSLPLVSGGRVYVFGGGHVAQELVPLLSHLGFRCVVFEDREEFTKPDLFPTAEKIIRGNFERLGDSLSLTEKDYAVIVTRGHIWDFEAWAFCLKSPAAYIGVIGSRHKHEFVKNRLRERGFSDEEIGATRVRAPVGLDIKSETPAEIAVSIAAELILVRAAE